MGGGDGVFRRVISCLGANNAGEVIFLRKGDPNEKDFTLRGVVGLHARQHRSLWLWLLLWGVHYSPYALSYYGSGLVPGYVTYSPYAVSYEQSGTHR